MAIKAPTKPEPQQILSSFFFCSYSHQMWLIFSAWHLEVQLQTQNHICNKAGHVYAPPPHILDHSGVACTGTSIGFPVYQRPGFHQRSGSWLWLIRQIHWRHFCFRLSSLLVMIFRGGGTFAPGLPGFA